MPHYPSDTPLPNIVAAETAVSMLASRTNTIISIEAALREQMPQVMQELDDARAEIPGLQEAAKAACRALGAGTHLIGGHAIQVKGAPTSTEVDKAGLLERAIDAGDVEDLIKLGVLKYDVVAHQIARLPTLQRVRYEGYLSTKTGTASVTLPPELK